MRTTETVLIDAVEFRSAATLAEAVEIYELP